MSKLHYAVFLKIRFEVLFGSTYSKLPWLQGEASNHHGGVGIGDVSARINVLAKGKNITEFDATPDDMSEYPSSGASEAPWIIRKGKKTVAKFDFPPDHLCCRMKSLGIAKPVLEVVVQRIVSSEDSLKPICSLQFFHALKSLGFLEICSSKLNQGIKKQDVFTA